MSDMEETEGTESPVAPHRVIGTPPPSPRLLGSSPVAQDQETALDQVSEEEEFLNGDDSQSNTKQDHDHGRHH